MAMDLFELFINSQMKIKKFVERSCIGFQIRLELFGIQTMTSIKD